MNGKDTLSYKARLVAKGFSHNARVDYDENFPPVLKHTSIQVLLSLIAQHSMEVEELDLKTTYLHGDLEKRIYITQLGGFVEGGKEDLMCKLKKSLYELKQSSRQCYKNFGTYMILISYKRGESDCCGYT